MVDGLHLPHLDEPHPHRLGGSLQDPLPVVLRLVQHLTGREEEDEEDYHCHPFRQQDSRYLSSGLIMDTPSCEDEFYSQ